MGLVRRRVWPERLRRRLNRPVPRRVRRIAYAATAAVFVDSWLPNRDGVLTGLGVTLWAAVLIGSATVWIGRKLICGTDETSRVDRRFDRPVICLVVTAILLICPVPIYFTFLMLRGPLNRLAGQSLAAPYPGADGYQLGITQVGPFTAYVHRCPHGVQVTHLLEPRWSRNVSRLSTNVSTECRPSAFVLITDPGECGKHQKPSWPLGNGWYMGTGQQEITLAGSTAVDSSLRKFVSGWITLFS